jgi:hypothetical protein
MLKVTIYDNVRVIDLTLAEPGVANWNLPMNESYFKIYKGARNTIEFVIRNNDRKPINLIGKKIIITIVDQRTWETLLQKPLRILDAYTGSVVLDLNGYEVSVWPLGDLTFSIMSQDSDCDQRLLYIDQIEGAHGNFELIDGPTMGPSPSYECRNFLSSFWGWPIQQYWFSSILPGSARRDNFLGLHSAIVYTRNFSGKIWALGCLENDEPDKDADVWFKLPLRPKEEFSPNPLDEDYHNYLYLNQYTGLTPISFTASLQWVRFMFLPDISAFDLNYAPDIYPNDCPDINRYPFSGFVDKILFRN